MCLDFTTELKMEQESTEASPSLLGDLAGRLGLDVPALLYLFTFLAGMLFMLFFIIMTALWLFYVVYFIGVSMEVKSIHM